MVALSVSTSAKASSLLILSPTFLCHSAITPSFMVSLNKGIRITVAPNDSGVTLAAGAAAKGAASATTGAAFSAAGAGLAVNNAW